MRPPMSISGQITDALGRLEAPQRGDTARSMSGAPISSAMASAIDAASGGFMVVLGAAGRAPVPGSGCLLAVYDTPSTPALTRADWNTLHALPRAARLAELLPGRRARRTRSVRGVFLLTQALGPGHPGRGAHHERADRHRPPRPIGALIDATHFKRGLLASGVVRWRQALWRSHGRRRCRSSWRRTSSWPC